LLVGGCGGQAPSAVRPGGHTFIDVVPEIPADLDETGTPDPAQNEILPSWSSELVRPRGGRPGPDATLPAADAVVPYLATSWRQSPNGDYTFQLRRGVRGATGDPFTAADVKWSIDREFATSPVAPFLFSLANVDASDPVTILGPFTVRINVTAPSPFLLGVLSWFDEGIYDRRAYLAHATATDPWAEQWGATHSATFGAYSVRGFLAGRRIVLSANPGSWVHPYYTTVEIEQIQDSATRLAAVLDGTADHTTDLTWGDFLTATQFGPVDDVSATILQTGPRVESWLLDLHSGPFANPLVRQALDIAVNRGELNATGYDGYATPDTLALPAIYGQPQTTGPSQAVARRLLARAGYRHGLTLHIDIDPDIVDEGISPQLQVLTNQLAEVGITLVPTTVANTNQMLSLEANHMVPSTIEDIAPLIGGGGFLLLQDDDSALDNVSPAAEDRYDDPALLALLQAMRRTPNGPAYRSLLARATAIVDRDLPAVNLLATPVQNVTNANITGYAAHAVPVTYYELLHPLHRSTRHHRR